MTINISGRALALSLFALIAVVLAGVFVIGRQSGARTVAPYQKEIQREYDAATTQSKAQATQADIAAARSAVLSTSVINYFSTHQSYQGISARSGSTFSIPAATTSATAYCVEATVGTATVHTWEPDPVQNAPAPVSGACPSDPQAITTGQAAEERMLAGEVIWYMADFQASKALASNGNSFVGLPPTSLDQPRNAGSGDATAADYLSTTYSTRLVPASAHRACLAATVGATTMHSMLKAGAPGGMLAYTVPRSGGC